MNKELVECLKDIVIALLVIVIVCCLIKYMFKENFILWGGRNLDSNICLNQCTGLREEEYRECAQKCREGDMFLNRTRASTTILQ
jgi:hypothetical protein